MWKSLTPGVKLFHIFFDFFTISKYNSKYKTNRNTKQKNPNSKCKSRLILVKTSIRTSLPLYTTEPAFLSILEDLEERRFPFFLTLTRNHMAEERFLFEGAPGNRSSADGVGPVAQKD